MNNKELSEVIEGISICLNVLTSYLEQLKEILQKGVRE